MNPPRRWVIGCYYQLTLSYTVTQPLIHPTNPYVCPPGATHCSKVLLNMLLSTTMLNLKDPTHITKGAFILWAGKYFIVLCVDRITCEERQPSRSISQAPLYSFNKELEPWLVWIGGLSAGLKTKGSLVRCPFRAHTWVPGWVPSRGHSRGNHTLMSFSLSFSLPSPLSKNK